LEKEIMINIFVSCSPPMTRSAWRTDANRQTGSRLFLPVASRCTVCHHPSPLLNSVSTTPGFKPSRHAPVAWSKGGATDGTRPDLHLPPHPNPPPPHHTQTLSLAGRSTSSAAAAEAAATIWTVVPSDRPAASFHACVPLHWESTMHQYQMFVTAETKLHCSFVY
jgi:hypothetical protein